MLRVVGSPAMGGTQLTELASNVRVIDVATAPFLSPAECREVIQSCPADAWYAGTRRAGTSADAIAGRDPQPFVDPSGKSRIEQPLPGGPTGELAQRIAARVVEINDEVYGFRVVGFEEPSRVLCYRGEHGDHVHDHIDLGPLHPLRKLAFSILLSDPADFDGGDLSFSGNVFAGARAQGTLTMFPSFLPHRVTPTTRGERYVIVGWVLGPTFT
jgi:predicted 2-oxoglutarate/Fe(II)-dependent dioxygenase YbiX